MTDLISGVKLNLAFPVNWLLGKLGKSGKVPYFGQFWLKLLKNLHTAS
jgi:hypothetical protein